jgi:hypothetical protein
LEQNEGPFWFYFWVVAVVKLFGRSIRDTFEFLKIDVER